VVTPLAHVRVLSFTKIQKSRPDPVKCSEEERRTQRRAPEGRDGLRLLCDFADSRRRVQAAEGDV